MPSASDNRLVSAPPPAEGGGLRGSRQTALAGASARVLSVQTAARLINEHVGPRVADLLGAS